MSSFVAPRQSMLPQDWARSTHLEDDPSSSTEQLTTPYHTANQQLNTASHILHPVQDTQDYTASATHYPDNLPVPGEPSPAFSFDDYLTPGYSSENPDQSGHPTPSVDDSQWTEVPRGLYGTEGNGFTGYIQMNNEDFDLTDPLNPVSYNYSARDLEPQDSMLTPGLTTTPSTPDQASGPHPNAVLKVQTWGLHPTSNASKRSYAHTESEMYTGLRSPRSSGEHSHSVPAQQSAVSPAVLVSTYTRGDSPARSYIPLSRSVSRRSQNSRLGGHVDTQNNAGAGRSSTLKPPVDKGQEEWDEDEDEDRSGFAPEQRDLGLVPSIKDIEEMKELERTNSNVQQWLVTSEAGSPTDIEAQSANIRDGNKKERLRSRSRGGRQDALGTTEFDNDGILGPNVVLDVEIDMDSTDEDDDEDLPESPAAHVDTTDPMTNDSYFPPMEEDEISPDQADPLPSQFVRKSPWQDALRGSVVDNPKVPGQPPTANAAIVFFSRQAANCDTASRAATWGTRRMSDSEVQSILDGSQISRHLSLTGTLADKARARGSSFINTVKSMPRRSSSFIKKRQQQQQQQQQELEQWRSSRQQSPENKAEFLVSPENEESRKSVSSSRPIKRMSSSSKHKAQKSPPLGTGGAIMAMNQQLAAVGQGSAAITTEPEQQHGLLGVLKRARSKSEIAKSPKANAGLSDLLNHHGGPPMPVLASPPQMKDMAPRLPSAVDAEVTSEEADDEVGVKMELPMKPLNVVPDIDGFRAEVRQLNPRLKPYLVDRIATDQLRRYKKLMKSKLDHVKKVEEKRQCPSGEHCRALGGKPTILAPPSTAKESGTNFAQFKVANGTDSDGDEAAMTDGVVTPALFPPGIPLPPTTHLPATFECFLCFQVKTFKKPSDWTKHVHEDVQPFSCTFPSCPEPKSFKRKADWVRHENERHRHLEWWKCNYTDCVHVCYRKDNFVQHLVREHKMEEPKGKAKAAGTRSKAPPKNAGPDDEFWQFVESCRGETKDTPRNEPCKFCGNICTSWKKLSVHVGKHMEQIAMPILGFVDKQNITPELVLSPTEVQSTRQYPSTPMLDTSNLGPADPLAHSPYGGSVQSGYRVASTGHSPVVMSGHHRAVTPTMAQNMHQAVYSPNRGSNGMMQPMSVTPGQHRSTPDHHYEAYNNLNAHQPHMAAQPTTMYHSPQSGPAPVASYRTSPIPGSLQMENYNAMAMNAMQGSIYGPTPTYMEGNHTGHTYVNNYGPGMGHDDGMTANTQSGTHSHGHTPIQTVSGAGDGMFYPPHPSNGAPGAQFY